MKKKKVLCAISGGVDSAVAALILIKKGYEVYGITYKIPLDIYNSNNYDNNKIKNAKKICEFLNIKHNIIDIRNTFIKKIMIPFCEKYVKGITPNVCVNCNKYIKFGILLDYSNKKGFDYLATGHYARNIYDNDLKINILKKGIDKLKDQSYFLYNLNQQKLKKIIFPLGSYYKKNIRKIAKNNNIPIYDEKDSQDICFVNGKYSDFIKKYYYKKINEKSIICDKKGNFLNNGKPIYNYTIGQRKGLGVSNKKPLYVISINNNENKIIVSEKKDLINKIVICNKISFNFNYIYNKKYDVLIKNRYKSDSKKGELVIYKNKFKILFKETVYSSALGQSIVIYDLNDQNVLGGGEIIKIYN